MKQILVIHLDRHDEECTVHFLGQEIGILRRGCSGSFESARELIAKFDGTVDAIGLQGLPEMLQLGPAHAEHVQGAQLRDLATQTPVVDGSGIRAGLERWGIILADRAQPGIFSA